MYSVRGLVLFSTVLLLPAAPERAGGQEPTDATALLRYSVERKSEWGAVALEWVAPVVGHAYAGDAKRGILPGVVTVGGLATFIAGIRCDSMCAVSGDTANNEGLAWAGLAALVVGRTWGFISAYQTAQDHNAEVRRRLGITVDGRTDGSVDVGIALRF